MGAISHHQLFELPLNFTALKYCNRLKVNTYDHRLRGNGHPVRSAIHKPQIGGLVVGWVTTSEYLLLYVFCLFVWHWRVLCFCAEQPLSSRVQVKAEKYH
jgi:hypothetical protein